MQTIICSPTKASFERAKILIKSGEVVAFPTETVYGLGANALDEKGVAKIFEAKGRPSDNPLIVHISDKSMVSTLARTVNLLAEKLINAFMPGSITLVFDKKQCVPDITTGGLDTVAIRLPESNVAREFITAVGMPIAAPSANRSKRPSPTTAQDVYADLNGLIPMIIDGGKCNVGIESTVVDVRGDIPIILRLGKVLPEDIEKVAGSVLLSSSISEKRHSPGTRYEHYCPNCECYLVKNDDHISVNNFESKGKVAILATDKLLRKTDSKFARVSLGRTNEDTAKNLYSNLIKCEKEYDILLLELCTESGIGLSVNDRMKKAAKGRIVSSRHKE